MIELNALLLSHAANPADDDSCCHIDGAEIVNVTTGLLVSVGETALLECRVDANPLSVDSLITWSRDGYDMSRAVIEPVAGDTSRLMITGVQRRDTGAFRCHAYNGVGHSASAVAALVVKCKQRHLYTVICQLINQNTFITE